AFASLRGYLLRYCTTRSDQRSRILARPILRPGLLLDVLHRVADGLDLLRLLVRDLHPELLLEAHDQLDQVERVRVEILDERRLRLDLGLVDAELLDDDLLQALV